MPPKSGRNILECYSRNVKPRPTCAKLVLLCKFACKSAADNLHSKNESGASGRVLRLRCYAPLRLRQSRRASTYLQGNSRVDEPFRMEDKTRAIISGAGETGNPRDTTPPPWRGRFCSFGFPDSRSAPHYASSDQHGGQP